MRGRTKLISLATTLAVLLTVSMVFASGLVDVSKLSLFSGPPIGPDSPSNDLFVSPAAVIKDYVNDPGYQIGDTLNIHINITNVDVVGMYSYQVNVTWVPGMFNFTGVTYGDFLANTASPYGTSRVEDIYMASNETAYASIAETILGDYPGISVSGRLVTLHFLITGYGNSTINISTGGTLPTLLLDASGTPLVFSTADGYFKNKITGDADGDKTVNVFDIVKVQYHWYPGPPVGAGGYSRDVDVDDDGAINVFDIVAIQANWGRTAP